MWSAGIVRERAGTGPQRTSRGFERASESACTGRKLDYRGHGISFRGRECATREA